MTYLNCFFTKWNLTDTCIAHETSYTQSITQIFLDRSRLKIWKKNMASLNYWKVIIWCFSAHFHNNIFLKLNFSLLGISATFLRAFEILGHGMKVHGYFWESVLFHLKTNMPYYKNNIRDLYFLAYIFSVIFVLCLSNLYVSSKQHVLQLAEISIPALCKRMQRFFYDSITSDVAE